MIGTMHDQRVGVGNVEAGFNDGGDHQDVEFAVVERPMMSSSTVAGIWPCATANFISGTLLSRKSVTSGEVLDPRHHVERLAAAIALTQQRLADHQRIVRRHEGAHRQSIDRRRGDDRKVAHAGQRQLQRAGIGVAVSVSTCTLGAQLLQPLLVADAEMLLFVDDEQAEIAELDGLAKQRMGTDDDVDRAVGELLLDLVSSACRDQARGLRDVDRETLKRSLKVL